MSQKNKNLSKVMIHTDGASRNNPGPAAIGAVVYDDGGNVLSEVSRYIGTATNNVAEYIAAIYGMQEACMMRAENAVLCLDSQLVARQLKGDYRVKDSNLRKFFELALNISGGFSSLEIREIKRADNKKADKLANKALDERVLL
ncbi:MAG: reverse transcriptase-like protein [Candidatus Omnitrophica bacterium]|nr:reverse transcriptase-like protein [Candidatus Omnitrophota bacterium]